MRRPVLRLAGLGTVLGVAAFVSLLVLPVSREGLRAAIEPFGAFAPLVFIVVGALLALSFVPGPLLSAASGIMFGTGIGLACSVASATLTSVLALIIARHSGRRAVEELSGPRAAALADLAQRRGVLVVVLQRLMPGVPDAPFSYLYGLLGMRAWQVALGTVIGSSPRAFSYTALGDAAATGDGALATVAIAVGVTVSVVGAVIGAVLVRRRSTLGSSTNIGTDEGQSHPPAEPASP
jgi:uncharacterized membrane protein YdjX (TVP38/TMEM64 family)